MSHAMRNSGPSLNSLASLIRGLYGRVASQLDVDPSYVSRVARGERLSEEIEAALEHEMRKIMKMMKITHNGFGRHTASHDGSNRSAIGRRRTKKSPTAKKKNTKAVHESTLDAQFALCLAGSRGVPP